MLITCCETRRQRRIDSLSQQSHGHTETQEHKYERQIFIPQILSFTMNISLIYIFQSKSRVSVRAHKQTGLGIGLPVFSFPSRILVSKVDLFYNTPPWAITNDILCLIKNSIRKPSGKMVHWRKEYIYTVLVNCTLLPH